MHSKRRILAVVGGMLLAAMTSGTSAASPEARLDASPFAAGLDAVVTSNEVLLGQSAALTGPMGQLGKRMNAGANAYLEQVNTKGGVHGRKVRLVVADDQHDPGIARKNTEQFIKQGVFSLFGYVGTSTTLAVKPMVSTANIPLVAPMSGSPALRQPVERMVFNVRASYSDELERQVQEIAASGTLRIAVVHQDDEVGQAGSLAARSAMRRRGMIPVAIVPVGRTAESIAKATSDIAASRPGAVIMIAPEASAQVVTNLRGRGTNPLFYHISYTDAMSMLTSLGRQGPGVLVTQVVPFPWSRSIPIVKEYQDAMRGRADENFDFASLEGYIAAKVAVEGLNRAGPKLTRRSYVLALESIENLDLGGFLVNFGSRSHAGSNLVETTMIGNKGAYIQ